MNWNPFSKKKAREDLRHNALLTAIARAHNQVVGLDGRVGKIELLVETVVRAGNDELLKELTEMREAQAKALARLDESLGSEVVKGLDGLKLALVKEFAATREAVSKVVPALVGDAKQRQVDHLEVAKEGRAQVARLFPQLVALEALVKAAGNAQDRPAATGEQVVAASSALGDHVTETSKALRAQIAETAKALATAGSDTQKLVADAMGAVNEGLGALVLSHQESHRVLASLEPKMTLAFRSKPASAEPEELYDVQINAEGKVVALDISVPGAAPRPGCRLKTRCLSPKQAAEVKKGIAGG